MKVFISADIEGVAGCTHWDEVRMGNIDYPMLRQQMTNEIKAACEGINEAFGDDTEILVKDSHATGRNVIIANLPQNVRLVRGWTSDPNSMIGGIDDTYDAVAFIGYHSGASRNGNPLSHTMNTQINYIKINGTIATEYTLHAYAAAEMGIPVVFLSGDKMLCEDAKLINPTLETVAVLEGLGDSTISLNPSYACSLIKEKIKVGLSKMEKCTIKLPEKFELEINYKKHQLARRASFYPGVELVNDTTVKYTAKTARDMMVTNFFILY
ncbi:M55 family metallopeptidase [Clostridiaceae bacterium M8S5]|nr:M55 family metallopeptidase [Clostridiaceae bacterium M8S5]